MKGKPRIRPEDATRLKQVLACGRWIKGRELVSRFGFNHRIIRAIAEETGEIISGQQGYKLASLATDDELKRALADLESRANHIMARAGKVRFMMHRRQEFQKHTESPDLFL